MVIWYMYVLQSDYHNKVNEDSHHLTLCVCVCVCVCVRKRERERENF